MKTKKTVGTLLADMLGQLDQAVEDAQLAYDDRSEKWQESEAGNAWSEGVTELETLRDSVDAAKDALPDKLLDVKVDVEFGPPVPSEERQPASAPKELVK